MSLTILLISVLVFSSYNINGCEPLAQEKKSVEQEKTYFFQTDNKLAKISIENTQGTIKVYPTDSNQITLKVTKKGGEKDLSKVKINATQTKNAIVIQTIIPESVGKFEVDYLMAIPRELRLSKMLACARGIIQVVDTHGDVDARNTAGTIEICNVRGNVTVKGPKADLIARNIQGLVDVRHLLGAKQLENIVPEQPGV